MKIAPDIIEWLLDSDPAIRWQVERDLLREPARVWQATRKRVAREGWGRLLIRLQRKDGHWGQGAYQPKWTSTTYTMLLLRHLGLEERHPAALRGCTAMLDAGFCEGGGGPSAGGKPSAGRRLAAGGINFSRSRNRPETCITGMTLCVCAFFRLRDARVEGMIDYLMREQMPDGGWNCRRFKGATHSSFHTTINVLEGLREYAFARGKRRDETEASEARAREFLLEHRLFRSHRTGEIVDRKMTQLHFPPRWHHDILRALEYFVSAKQDYDPRMEDAVGLVRSKRRKDGRWTLPTPYRGVTHFQMEPPGRASRWNTLRALRVTALMRKGD